MQTIQTTAAGDALMIKKQRIYNMLFNGDEPPVLLIGAAAPGCRSAQIVRAHRLEHPHCAFFKKEMELKGMNVLRRTLYTTDNWLHTDYQIMQDGSLALMKKFIRNEGDLKSLYFYLTDLSVNKDVDYKQPEDGIQIYRTTMLPLEQCLEIWMDRAEYDLFLQQNRQLLDKCFYHMAQIITAEAKLLSETVPEGSLAVLDMGCCLADCPDEEYVQWRAGFIKKIRKIAHMPVMVRIDGAPAGSVPVLPETGADILVVSLRPEGISAAEALDLCGASFAVLDIDHLDDVGPLKDLNLCGRGAFLSSDAEKLAQLKQILQA